MIELRTQGLFVSLKRVCSGFVCFLRRFCSPWKGKCCMKICLPMLGRSCKHNCKVWQEACIEWNSHDHKILWIPAFFLPDRFFLNPNGSKMKNLRLLVAIDQIAFNNWWCSFSDHKSFKRIHQLFCNIGKTIRAYTSKKYFHQERVRKLWDYVRNLWPALSPVHLGHNKKWILAERLGIGFLRQELEDEPLPPLLRTFTPSIIIRTNLMPLSMMLYSPQPRRGGRASRPPHTFQSRW